MLTWHNGLKAARKEYQKHPDDLLAALMSFVEDPPDTPYQWGYLEGVREMIALKTLRRPHRLN
jgi:hypothetical protein